MTFSLPPQILPQSVLAFSTPFYVDDVVSMVAAKFPEPLPADYGRDKLYGQVSDYLEQLVWLGMLWKSGNTYEVRARLRA